MTDYRERNLIEAAHSAQEGITLIELVPPSMVVPPAPRFTFGTFPANLATWYYSQAGLGRIGVFRIADCELMGQHMLGRIGELFVCPELNIHPPHIAALFESRAAAPPRKIVRLPGRHAVLGPGFEVYGHWLVDILPRLYLLEAAGFSIDSLSFLLPTNMPSFGIAWLNLLGLSENQFVRYDPGSETVIVEELLVATMIHNGARVTPLFKNVVDFLKARLTSACATLFDTPAHRRIFVSRAQASQSRRLVNRVKIEEMATKAGYEIVRPEQLHLLDQIRLFAEARELVGEYGSALHGSIFSAPGTTICALRGSVGHPGFIQSGLGHVLDQSTGYVFGDTDTDTPEQAFIVSEDAFADCLRLALNGRTLN